MSCWCHVWRQWEAKEWPLYREVRAANTSPWPCPLGSRGRAHNGAGEGAADKDQFWTDHLHTYPHPHHCPHWIRR